MESTHYKRQRAWGIFACAAVGVGAVMLITPRPANAQNADLDDLRIRVERLEKENQELRQSQVSPPIGDAAPQQPGDPQVQQAQAQQAPGAAVVGSDLSIKTSLKDGLFLWFETPNKDFTMHLGGWMQLDNVFWDQSSALKTAQGATGTAGTRPVASGDLSGGIGDLQDGTYFRRIRPFVEGTFWETGEYRLILALENDQVSTTGLDEFWVGETQIPVIGSVRVGHVKTPMGLEGDMTASSRCMTFMERSSYSEAIELNQNFVTGLWASNNYLDQRVTWEAAAFRPDKAAATGAFFGDDQWGLQGRLTALPLYEDEGRHLLHVGLSGGWRTGGNTTSTVSQESFELQARPELRDDDPAGAFGGVADSNRMIDTGFIASGTEYLMGTELLYIRGPFSFQAEYGWNFINDATGVFNPGAVTAANFKPFATPQNYVFNGGYVQLAYTLTGENRAYDKRIGTLAREYYGHSGPYSNAYIVRDEDGHICTSWGAWEIAARYSYTDLNDGSGATRIQGGQMDGFTLALNWTLNNNLNVMFDWVYDNRYNLPTAAPTYPGGTTTTIPGYTSGFGTRVQFQF